MATCAFLTRDLIPTCEALTALGGVNKTILVGQVSDINTIAFGVDGEIITFSLVTGASLKSFSGKKEKNQGTYELVAGETVNLFNQAVILSLYFYNDAERAAINQLVNAEDMFCIVQTNAGQLEVYGIANGALLDYAAFGLEGTAGTGNGTGILINDDKSYKVTLSGNVPNLPMTFLPTNTLAANLVTLGLITYPNTQP